jgi:hypothetical protein
LAITHLRLSVQESFVLVADATILIVLACGPF